MRNFLIKVVLGGVGIYLAALLLPGIHLGTLGASWQSNLWTYAVVALIFGVTNAVLKPIAEFFSFPFIIFTLGLFIVLINALMLQVTEWIAAAFNAPFSIDSFFWTAIWGSLIISLFTWVASIMLPSKYDGRS